MLICCFNEVGQQTYCMPALLFAYIERLAHGTVAHCSIQLLCRCTWATIYGVKIRYGVMPFNTYGLACAQNFIAFLNK